MKSGFSLVELSIVLVILGLLTGGILAGQSLIRAAELRAVPTEYGKYHAAIMSFKDKYFQIPGDFSKAESFWGTADASNSLCKTTPSTDSKTCNGDGNGIIEGTNSLRSIEFFRFWQHLANAGLIEGQYNGIAGPAGNRDSLIGTNGPASKVANAGWSTETLDNTSATYTNPFLLDFGNSIIVGSDGGSATYGGLTRGPGFRPEEAWNIDSKMDDGKPGTGKIVHDYDYTACTTATVQTNNLADYKLTSNALACSIRFIKVY